MVFIILANQQFYSDLKTNKWHIATQLADKGHKVIYVDPPLRFKALKKINKGLVEHVNENLTLYRPINILNFKPFSIINTIVHNKILSGLVKEVNKNNEAVVLYIYHFDFPDLRDLFGKLKHNISVYDCVDIYAEFPEYAEGKKVNPFLISLIQKIDDSLKIKINQQGLSLKDWVDDQEKWLCKNTDLVFASAPGIVIHLNEWRKDVHYLPSGVDFEKFDVKRGKLKEPHDIVNIPHPRIGFTGAIDTYKNNIKLIEKCVKAYPNYHFIMIGPEKLSDPDLDLTGLKKFKNIHFLGQKPWEQTPSYFSYFDAYFIPYNLNDYTKGCHPIKYFEGLAAGLPTLSTLESVKQFDPDGYVATEDDQFIKNIERAINENSEEKIQVRKKVAQANTWSGKADKIIRFVAEKLKS